MNENRILTLFRNRLIAWILLSVLGAFVVFSLVVGAIYFISDTLGDNVYKEWIVIYRQVQKPIYDEAGNVISKKWDSEVLPPVKRWSILLPALLLNNLIVMIFLIGTGIYLSNSILSPIKRISQSLESIIQEKKPQRIDIHEPDIFTELVQNINLLIEKSDQ